MADLPRLTDTSPQDWKYIAEGGATIVFSYAGKAHPQFDGTALRLRKSPVGRIQPEPATTEIEPEDESQGEPNDPTIVFQRTVIERLIPKQFLPRLDAVRVERAWLQQLADQAEAHRPQERRAKDRIDLGRSKAVLATDLVGGDGWAVEIKPKWGFMPAKAHLAAETREIKTRTCRFCMHAHMRHAQGEAVALGYCPLDLFAGDSARVTRALHALWDAWVGSGGAVNNLRVFVQGRRVVPAPGPDNVNLPASLAPLAAQLFPSPSPSPASPQDPTASTAATRDALTAALLPLLLDTPVLHTLSTLQRTLDALDADGLAALWARLRPDGPAALGAGAAEPDLAAWTRFVDAYLARHRAAQPEAEHDRERARERPKEKRGAKAAVENAGEDENAIERGEEKEGATEKGDEDELRYRLQAYLLSASFKDCSLILRFRPGQQQGSITVIDLDVKGMDRLAKWAKLDRTIVEAYRSVPPRECVDAWASAPVFVSPV